MPTLSINNTQIEITQQQADEIMSQYKKSKVCKFEVGDTYWFIDSCGYIWINFWKNDEADQYRLSIGNVFKTEEEARDTLKTGWVALSRK